MRSNGGPKLCRNQSSAEPLMAVRDSILSHPDFSFGVLSVNHNLPALPSVLLLLLLLSVDLAPSGTRLNTVDSFKSKTDVDNKRHTSAHLPLTSHSPMGISIPPSPPTCIFPCKTPYEYSQSCRSTTSLAFTTTVVLGHGSTEMSMQSKRRLNNLR